MTTNFESDPNQESLYCFIIIAVDSITQSGQIPETRVITLNNEQAVTLWLEQNLHKPLTYKIYAAREVEVNIIPKKYELIY